MESGTLVKWHKKPGDKIDAGDLLFEVTTDKATVEHTAIDEGWLRQILVKEGEDAVVNQPVAVFTAEKDETLEGYTPEGAAPEKKETPKAQEPSSEKKAPVSDTEVPAERPSSGESTFRQPAFVPSEPIEDYEFEFPTEAVGKRIPATPLARKIAKEKKLDLSTVKGTGPSGRITSRDLDTAQPMGFTAIGRGELPHIKPGTYEEVRLTTMRKAIAKRLQESKSFIPHFYVAQTINAEALVHVREQLASAGLKLSYNDFVIRACALCLRNHPKINSGFNSVNNTIILFKTIDISIAVTLEEGLITPIVRHADYKSLGELSVEVKSLAKRAREGKLLEQEYKGGSFTISNMGMFGVTGFQAIINPPQSSILAVGAIEDTPVVKNGQVVAGKTMNVTLSVDHRVVDGVAAAEFIRSLKKMLESPAVLLV